MTKQSVEIVFLSNIIEYKIHIKHFSATNPKQGQTILPNLETGDLLGRQFIPEPGDIKIDCEASVCQEFKLNK